MIWEMINGYKMLVRKPQGKTPLGRAMCSWKDNIKMGLRMWTGFQWLMVVSVDWLLDMVMKLCPRNSRELLDQLSNFKHFSMIYCDV
jgi:hypothetical protein